MHRNLTNSGNSDIANNDFFAKGNEDEDLLKDLGAEIKMAKISALAILLISILLLVLFFT